jgi:hypothetical protein
MSREGGDEREEHRDPTTGRFTPGRSANPSGRPKGIVAVAKAKNLRDLVLLAAERHGQKIDPKSEDGVAAYLEWLAATEPRSFSSLLGKILPLMPVKLALPPIEKPADLVAASSAIAKAVSEGELSPNEASAISHVVDGVSKSLEIHVLAERLDRLEEQMAKKDERR